jgi:HlyD family secretion protein
MPRRSIRADPREFQPALVRLQELPPSPLGRRMLWAALIFLAALLGWAVFGKLDIVAVAEGRLVPDTYLKIVQPADAGVVKEILVKEGEQVKEGQILMRMDASLSTSDLKTLSADYHNKRLSLRRIDAQLAGEPLERNSDDPPQLFLQVQAQYLANRQAYESALAQERALLDKARSDLAAAEAIRRKLVQVLPHYREQEAAYAKLEKDGFAGRLMHTDKRRERIEKEHDLQAQEAVIVSAAATISQAEKKVAQITADYRRALQTERVDVANQLERAREELAKQEHRHGYLELRAPQAGTVKDLATHTVGTVASPGTILMTLVPRDEHLRAEVWVKNDDIGFVRREQLVKLKLSAFTFQKYGMLEGEVAHVSADAAEQGATASGSAPAAPRQPAELLAYRTLVNLRSQTLDAGGVKYRLQPGMQVSAEIHLGTRTVLEYVLSPVQKAFHEAARER